MLFFLITNTHSTQAQQSLGLTNVGYATFNLTARDFNCDGFLQAVEPLDDLHIVFLYNTFGNNFSCLKILLKDPRTKTLEVNLINEPAHRNNRMGSYEFLFGVGTPNMYSNKLKSRDRELRSKFFNYVKPLQKLLSTHLQPNTTLLINPGLESNVSVPAARVLFSWTRKSFPNARLVWNPFRESLRTRRAATADLIEGHGPNPPIKAPCVFDMDGTDVKYNNRPALNEQTGNYIMSGQQTFQTIQTYANLCEVAFLWTQESNGLKYNESFKDPRRRKNFIEAGMYRQIMADLIRVYRKGIFKP